MIEIRRAIVLPALDSDACVSCRPLFGTGRNGVVIAKHTVGTACAMQANGMMTVDVWHLGRPRGLDAMHVGR
jgi:hypothetical protein